MFASSPSTLYQITDHQLLLIILAVLLPTFACLTIVIVAIVCYRRRATTFRLKGSENSERLQAIVVQFPTSPVEPQYLQKNLCISFPQLHQPKTKTIVYNRFSSIHGQNNAAFDDDSLKNDQQPILDISSTTEQPTDSLQTEFPPSLQSPVSSISSIYLQAIASHSNPPPILLFSQRTEF